MEPIDSISDDKWFEMLLRSVNSKEIDGIEFPGFPSEEIQAQFVGSSYETALREGFDFYGVVKSYSAALTRPLDKTTKFLDFGCGWGRFLRIFRNDISENNLFGVDVDPTILDECLKTGVSGELSRIFPEGKLPYPDAFFDCVIAYSVFTHLPENMHNYWVREIARVAKPGCVFVLTLQSRLFFDFIEKLDAGNPATLWHAALSRFASELPGYRKSFNEGKFVYLPTGGGDFRAADVYGEAIVPLKYIEQSWNDLFNIIDYIDTRFMQAVLITQRW